MLPERFWVQIIRRLARESLAGTDDVARLEVNPRRLTAGQAMRIELDLLDARLAGESRVAVTAVVERADGEPVAELELRRLWFPGTKKTRLRSNPRTDRRSSRNSSTNLYSAFPPENARSPLTMMN